MQAGRDVRIYLTDGTRERHRLSAGRFVEECPYPGLAAFGPEQAQWFFGREGLVRELTGRLDLRLTDGGVQVVVAPSGAGKSSLLRAGLLPALDQIAPGSHTWPKIVITPTAEPLRELASASGSLTAREHVDPADVLEALRGDTPGVVVVDQFEELFTLCSDDGQRREFLDVLGQLADATHGRPSGLVVVGVRADFYAACANYPGLRAALQDAPLVVGPMSETELREAIIFPARSVGLDLEPGLVELLLRDLGVTAEPGGAGYEAGRLPLLAHALRTSWQQREGATLTVQGYRDSGGIQGAIATTADHVYDRLDEVGQRAARSLFLRLVKIGDGTEDTRRRVPITELSAPAAVVDAFTAARLLTRGQDTVEITHEVLLRSWPHLREWVNTDRVGQLTHQDLEDAAASWDRADRDASLLFSGSRLDTARTWARNAPPGELSPLGKAFLTACARARHRAARLRTVVIAGLTALVVVAAAAAYYGRHQRDLTSSRLAATASASLRESNPPLAAQLALASFRLAPNLYESRSALLSVFSSDYANVLTGHTSRVDSVAYNQNGTLLASSAQDHTTRLWDVADPHRPHLIGVVTGETRACGAAFSPDDHTLTVASLGDAATLWDITDPGHPVKLTTLAGAHELTCGVSFSRSGIMATATSDGLVQLWDLRDRQRPSLLQSLPHPGILREVSFSPDGTTLAAAGQGFARLWEIAPDGRAMPGGELSDWEGDGLGLAFNGKGNLLATAGSNGSAVLWNIADRTHPLRLGSTSGHEMQLRSVAFSPDEVTLATASNDGKIRLWDITDSREPYEKGDLFHAQPATSVAFSKDGRTLVSASDDRTVRLWDLPLRKIEPRGRYAWYSVFRPAGDLLATSSVDQRVGLWTLDDLGRPIPHATVIYPSETTGLAFSPDGRLLASTHEDGVVRLVDLADSRHPVIVKELTGHTDAPEHVSFSPDGKILASAGRDDTARLWTVADVRNASLAAELAVFKGNVSGALFTPDGKTLVTASNDYSIRLWDVTNPQVPRPLSMITEHTDIVWLPAISHDGHLLATASMDGTTRLWDIAGVNRNDPRALATIATNGYQGFSRLAFSPDDTTLATGSDDGLIRLWNLADIHNPQDYAALAGHSGRISYLSFNPDGRTLASASVDASVLTWSTDTDQVAERICAIVRQPLDEDAWDHQISDIPYTPPCS